MPDTPTTRVGLYKSASDGSENVDYTLDLGQNWDKVDAAVGFQIVTSSTRPGTPYAGKAIAESDTTYRTYFSNGTSPASASWVQIPNSSSTFDSDLDLTSGKQLNIGGSGSTASIAILNSAAGIDLISGRVTGDTQSRYIVDTDGSTAWGPGNAATDIALTRGAASRLDLSTSDLRIATAGRGLQIAEGSNARMGVATLVAGTVTVSNTSVTATSRVWIQRRLSGGTIGHLTYSRSAGTSLTITSSSATDTSTVDWLLIEPA